MDSELKSANDAPWRPPISLVVQVAVFVGLLGYVAYLSFARADLIKTSVEEFDAGTEAKLTLAFLALFINYCTLVLHPGDRFQGMTGRWMLALFAPAALVALVTPPFLSRDVFGYLVDASNIVHFGCNPFLEPMGAAAQNPWLQEIGPVWWTHLTAAYGPTFYLILLPFVVRLTHTILVPVYLFKLFNAAVFGASVFACDRILRAEGLGRRATVLFALNPSVVIHVVGEAHNDGLIILLILLAIWAMLAGKWTRSALALAIATGIKFIAPLLLPIVVFDGKVRWRRILGSVAIVAGVFVVCAAPFGMPFREIAAGLRYRQTLPAPSPLLYAPVPTIAAMDAVFGVHAQAARTAALGLVYLLAAYFCILRRQRRIEFVFWVLLAIAFLTTRWFMPWYPLTAIAVGCLLTGRTGYGAMVLVLTGYSLLHYFRV